MKEYTIPGGKANLYGLLGILPVAFLYCLVFTLIWRIPGTGLWTGWISVIALNKPLLLKTIDAGWLVLVVILAGIMAHELIHAVFMASFSEKGFRSVSFGFNLKAVAPYTHCKEKLSPLAYRVSLMMPAILLGDLPALAGLITGNILFLFFGIIFTWAATGDFIVLWLGRHLSNGSFQDHPEKIGFIHIEE